MVDPTDPEHKDLLRFAALWTSDYSIDCLLVYSTGRSPTLYKQLRSQAPLLTPNLVICSVGTEIMSGDTMTSDEGWETLLNEGWDRLAVLQAAKEFPQLQLQQDSEQRPHKVSFHVPKDKAQEAVDGLTASLTSQQLKFKIIYSGGLDLDVLPERAGKGSALSYLLQKMKGEGRTPDNILVCGDSGNDAELFTVPAVNGVMVGNAMEELVQFYEEQKDKAHIFRASERCAGGILEAMKHFNFAPSPSPRDLPSFSLPRTDGPATKSEVVRALVHVYLILERWLRGDLPAGSEEFDILASTMSEDTTSTVEGGVTNSGLELVAKYQSMHGLFKDCRIFIDRAHVSPAGPGEWEVRFHEFWLSGGEVKVAQANDLIVLGKEGSAIGWVIKTLHQKRLE
eukprot:TRINITY_DN4561_c0_g1_i1.p1 TRINITY_DN4561_c0_g1~~TRINITY_DN4561_c0_g1_i1.p1  ORF type:complete len:428 (+),score=80.60 TRINITY_DN4561_c0_g1_i1:97-1284(+)